MKRLIYLLSFLIVLGSITGCDNFDLLLSEKKLNRKIQKTWKISLPYPYDGASTETWTFQDGTVALHIKDGTHDTTFVGSYSVDARISKAYVSLSNFTFGGQTNFSHKSSDDVNRRWDLVELEGSVFYLSSKNSKGTIQSLEFVEQ
jgi:hypothetical protein